MCAKTLAAFFVALIPIAAAAASPPPANQPVPPAPILKLVSAVVSAVNADDASALSKLYTNDAVVVDEIPAFVWRGPGAGVAWWRSVDAFIAKKPMRLKLAGVRVSEFQRSTSDAYLIQPMTINEISGDRPSSESGTMTYTFHENNGTWLISSQVWTTKP